MKYLDKEFEAKEVNLYRPIPSDIRRCDLSEVGMGLKSRMGASIAAQIGEKYIIADLSDFYHTNMSKCELNRLAGIEYANGANVLRIPLATYSERHQEKYDYFTRLGYLLGKGCQQVNVAVLCQSYNEELLLVCNSLAGRNIEYHFLQEDMMLKYGFVNGRKIGCGECTYDYLILPKIHVLDSRVEKMIQTYVNNGGKVLLFQNREKSNCTLRDCAESQPYCIANKYSDIFATYRVLKEMKYLYVINASQTDKCEQTFDFGDKVHSFIKLNLQDFSTQHVPLTIALEPGEDAVLLPYARAVIHE